MAATARNWGQTVSSPGAAEDDGLREGDEVSRGEKQREPLHPEGLALHRSAAAREQLEHDDDQDDQQRELGHGAGDGPQVEPERGGEEQVEHDPDEEQRQRSGDRHVQKGADHQDDRGGDDQQDDQAVRPDLGDGDLERRQRQGEEVLDRAVLAFPDQRGPGEDHGERGDLVDEGDDRAEPGRLAVGIELLADNDAQGQLGLRVAAVDERGDAIGEDVLDVAGTDARLLHCGGVHGHLHLGGPAAAEVETRSGSEWRR